ncbi:MAG: helix-turn-helix transcriptional regulator [Selenomonadaceae bacterium]|nr:helix-turn-helix transcriptional regulator [Selenomonadaceae bacterium]MBR6713523.1 helix-turn-helix transcriptional regulator [Selenomonadaceae bacterium]
MESGYLKGIPINKTELWRLILERGEALTKLSKASGLDGGTLARILKSGKARPTTISKLAKFFGVNPTSLIKGDEL